MYSQLLRQSWAAQGNLEGTVAYGRPVLQGLLPLLPVLPGCGLLQCGSAALAFSSGSAWFFLVLKNFSAWDLKLHCLVGCFATHGIISREDVHCAFRIGIGRLKPWNPANICLIVRWKGAHCQSPFPPLGLPILGEQTRISKCLPSSCTQMASFGDCILTNGPDLVPDPHNLHCILNLHSRYVPQKHFEAKCVFMAIMKFWKKKSVEKLTQLSRDKGQSDLM